MQRLTGVGVSPGVVCGRAVLLIQRAQVVRYQIASNRVDRELARLEQSQSRARDQLVHIRGRIARRGGPELASLFDAQLLMLDDALLVPRASTIVREQRVNAEWALQQVLEQISALFDDVADPYLRERTGDVADVIGRLKMNLRHGVSLPRDLLRDVDERSVLIADELTPSVAAQLDWTKIRGFASDAGSRTYHTAILARSLEIPAVVGLHLASRLVQPGQLVVIDGTASELLLDPDAETLARIEHAGDDDRTAARPASVRHVPAATADGVRIRLEANIEFPDDLAAAKYAGAEGIGLYRSEFLLTRGPGSVSEEQQYDIYRRMVEGMSPGPVTVRTFDLDEDQLALGTNRGSADEWVPDEDRRSRQGLRGLRLSLARPELFRTQLAALLRAARHGTLRIMFPFVSAVEQVREARRLIEETAAQLARRGEAVPSVPVGVMIEIPAAAYTADLLAREVDFFTIGTNDLIQYCLAVDRVDERVSTLYQPLHPAIVRVILMVSRAARRRRIPVSLCGEMASDPALLTLLVGLGLREFSMTPGAIGVAKQVLAEARTDELRLLARRILRLSTADDIERELQIALGGLQVGKAL